MHWTQSEIRAKVRCGSCHGQLGKRVNIISLSRKATWEFPSCGNILTGESGEACAIICDPCYEASEKALGRGIPGVEIKEAVEFTDAGPVYHPVDGLEQIPGRDMWVDGEVQA